MPLKREQAAEFIKKAEADGLSADEIRIHLQNLGGVEPSPEVSKNARSGLLKAVEYPGSVVRAGVHAPIIEAVTGKDLKTDFKKAIKGEETTPGTAELLRRGGVPELGRISNVVPGFAEQGTGGFLRPEKGGALDITGRGIIGFGGDVIGDPLTYGTSGLKSVAQSLEKAGLSKTAAGARIAAEPIGSAIRGTGKAIYKSGVMPAEMEAAKYGKEALTQNLIDEGVYSAPWKGSISNQMDTLGEKYLTEAEKRVALAGETGAPARMSEAVKPMLAKAKQLREMGDPKLIREAEAIESRARELMNLDPKYAMTPIEKVPSKISTVDLPMQQGPEYTPIKYRPEQVLDYNLPSQSSVSQMTPVSRRAERISEVNLPIQSGEVTPVEKLAAQISTVELPNPRGSNWSLNPDIDIPPTQIRTPGRYVKGGPTEQVLNETGPAIVREPPGYQRSGPTVETVSEQSTGPGLIRVAPGYEPSGPITRPAQSTGPFQFIEPGGFIKGGPTTEETKGLLAPQVRFMKTRANENVRKNAWNPNAVNDLDAQISKLEGQGLREEELATIERALGPEERAAQEAVNRKLGSILTTKEKQAMHEARMAKKLPLGQLKAAALMHDPLAGLGMIGAQVLEKSMTPVGYGVYKLGEKPSEAAWRQFLLRNTEE